jgi:hypothetical protein
LQLLHHAFVAKFQYNACAQSGTAVVVFLKFLPVKIPDFVKNR